MDDPLAHLSRTEIRQELAGFPEDAIDATLALKSAPSPSTLRHAVLLLLGFFLPAGVEVDLAALPPEATLREEAGIDSLSFSEAAFKLEELFDLRIENTELIALQSVGDLTRFLEGKLAEGSPA